MSSTFRKALRRDGSLIQTDRPPATASGGSVLDAYLREKPEAWMTKKAYSPVRVDEDNCYVSGGTLYIPVKNWFDHTDLTEVKLAGDHRGRHAGIPDRREYRASQ